MLLRSMSITFLWFNLSSFFNRFASSSIFCFDVNIATSFVTESSFASLLISGLLACHCWCHQQQIDVRISSEQFRKLEVLGIYSWCEQRLGLPFALKVASLSSPLGLQPFSPT
jgi:hypothetical protein